MGHLSAIDLFGYWLGIFLTFAILSFLYKDNPVYKIAEHLFIGVSIGYVVTLQYFDVIKPKLVENLAEGNLRYLIGLALALMLFVKAVSKRWSWLGRYPIGFVVGFYAGLQINGVQADLTKQMEPAMSSVVVDKVDVNADPPEALQLLPGMNPSIAKRIVEVRAEKPFASIDEIAEIPGLPQWQLDDLEEARGAFNGLDAQASVSSGDTFWFGTFAKLLMLMGLIASLVYFYFSVEHKGAIGKVSRFGVWVLMIGFGAAFGYTVQGRLALAIGRALDVLGRDKDPALAAQIDGGVVAVISIVVIVGGIVAWELLLRRRRESDTNK
jgi:DNA uptake protein ComE-like DNA-binding protein